MNGRKIDWRKFEKDRAAAFRSFVVDQIIPHCPQGTCREIQAKLEEEQAAAIAMKDYAKWEALDSLGTVLWKHLPLFGEPDDAS
jgi:mannitol-1-phosphate/altronate dehydrogenase